MGFAEFMYGKTTMLEMATIDIRVTAKARVKLFIVKNDLMMMEKNIAEQGKATMR